MKTLVYKKTMPRKLHGIAEILSKHIPYPAGAAAFRHVSDLSQKELHSDRLAGNCTPFRDIRIKLIFSYLALYTNISLFATEKCEFHQIMQKAGVPKYTCFVAYLTITVKTNYSLIPITTPEPTVLPPSRIAKRRPSSIAIGVMSSTFITTLSPGMHISTPSSSVITPVTSVVRK